MLKDMSVRPDEMRIVIRRSDASADDARLIPAEVFRKTFNTVLAALKAADKIRRASTTRSSKSPFLVSHLRLGSNEFGFAGHRDAVALLKRCATDVYRSDFSSVAEHPDLARKIAHLGKVAHQSYAVIAQFDGSELPIDDFFAKQVDRIENAVAETKSERSFFVGSAIGSFDGRLGNIDYRGAAWRGHLMLHTGDVQIECVFDRTQGEDAFNPFGNKRVTVTGRAIYTGDSALPERIEVVTIEAIPEASRPLDIRGSLFAPTFKGWLGRHG